MKVFNGFHLLTIFTKSSILGVFQGSGYASGYLHSFIHFFIIWPLCKNKNKCPSFLKMSFLTSLSVILSRLLYECVFVLRHAHSKIRLLLYQTTGSSCSFHYCNDRWCNFYLFIYLFSYLFIYVLTYLLTD